MQLALTIISVSAIVAFPQLQSSSAVDVATATATATDAPAPTGTDIPSRFPFVAPEDVQGGSVRCTCPMMNTFANHGIISRSGKGVTRDQVNAAFNLINFDSSMVNFFLNGVFPTYNTTADSFDLDRINGHNHAVEHSASLVRDDIYYNNDAMTTNQTLVSGLIASSKDGQVISFDDMINWRKVRVADSLARNPTFNATDFGLTQGFIAAGEASVFLVAFGNGQNQVPLDAVNAVLGQNRLPDGYLTPSSQTTVVKIIPTVASVFLKTHPLQFLNPFQNWYSELTKFFHQ